MCPAGSFSVGCAGGEEVDGAVGAVMLSGRSKLLLLESLGGGELDEGSSILLGLVLYA